MRLPQTAAAFKKTTRAGFAALLLAPVLTVAPVMAQDEEEAYRASLFTCGTDPDEDRTFLDLTGVETDAGTYTDLRFENRGDGEASVVYSFPPEGVDGKTAFLFSHSTGPEGYLVSIRWVDRGSTYVYYSLDIPPDPAVEDDMGGGDAGLAISRDGKLVERISCIERPYMFISYMRDAMSCDIDNPYGEGACGESTWLRDRPLDVTTLGIVP